MSAGRRDSLAVWLYRRALRLLPGDDRAEYGAAVLETFERRLADVQDRSLLARAWLVARELAGLLRVAVLRDRGRGATMLHADGGRGEDERNASRGAQARAPRRGLGGEDASRPSAAGRSSGSPGDPVIDGARWVPALARESRTARRRLARSPGFTLATLLTLAVAIGANAAIFGLVDGVLLSPLPYPEPQRLVALRHTVPGFDIADINQTLGTYLLYRDENRTFEAIGIWDRLHANLTGEGPPERVEVGRLTLDLFDVLRTPPLHGRRFLAEDTAGGAPPVVILGHGLWTRRFGSDPEIVGSTLDLYGIAHEIVGVMPEGFAFPDPDVALWTPRAIPSDPRYYGSFSYEGIGRLRPGVSAADAERDLARVVERLPEAFPERFDREYLAQTGLAPRVVPLKEFLVGDAGGTLWLLAGSTGFVLLIACANVANLFLVRSESRQREVAVRAALGAGRRHLAAYFFSESLLLAAAGGLLGLGLAAAALRIVPASGIDIPRLHEVGLDAGVLVFTTVVSALVGLLFGALPLAGTAQGAKVGRGLPSGRGHIGGGRRLRDLLVVTQAALALVLLAGAGLMARTVWNLAQVDPGFDPRGVLTFRLSLPGSQYRGQEDAVRFYDALVERLEALPGVEAAGVSRCLPLEGWCGGDPLSSPDSPLTPEQLRTVVSVKRVGGHYFQALGIPLLVGRPFEPNDGEPGAEAAILSEAAADYYFPGLDPIGKRVYPSGEKDAGSPWFRVVGVVGTVRRERLDEAPAMMLYLPARGLPADYMNPHDGAVAVRAAQVRAAPRSTRAESPEAGSKEARGTFGGAAVADPLALVEATRQAVWSIDPNLPVAQVRTMDEAVAAATAGARFFTLLVGLAAVAAVLLGTVGIYGVVSYAVGRRTAEIGVRMALGAAGADVRRMVLRQGLVTVGVGVGLGLAGALALGRLLRSFLYEVSPTDPATLAAGSLALLAAATVAILIPARRAASVDPVEALRSE